MVDGAKHKDKHVRSKTTVSWIFFYSEDSGLVSFFFPHSVLVDTTAGVYLRHKKGSIADDVRSH